MYTHHFGIRSIILGQSPFFGGHFGACSGMTASYPPLELKALQQS